MVEAGRRGADVESGTVAVGVVVVGESIASSSSSSLFSSSSMQGLQKLYFIVSNDDGTRYCGIVETSLCCGAIAAPSVAVVVVSVVVSAPSSSQGLQNSISSNRFCLLSIVVVVDFIEGMETTLCCLETVAGAANGAMVGGRIE